MNASIMRFWPSWLYPKGMEINVTYRTIEQSGGRLLRVRFRQADGTSAVVMFHDPDGLLAAVQKSVRDDSSVEALQSDLLVVEQMKERTHFRRHLDLTQEELAGLGATMWSEPQKFNLSFQRANDGHLVLTGREIDPPAGSMSLDVQATIMKAQFAEHLAVIGLKPNEVRDANLYGTRSMRPIDEDEVDLLFDSIQY